MPTLTEIVLRYETTGYTIPLTASEVNTIHREILQAFAGKQSAVVSEYVQDELVELLTPDLLKLQYLLSLFNGRGYLFDLLINLVDTELRIHRKNVYESI